MKKTLVLALAALMVPSIALAEAPWPISVYLKGENMADTKKEASIIRENRTYLPLRVIAEDLGFKVDWNQEKKQVKISNDENQVTMRIGSKNYSHNQEEKEMDVKPFVDSNKTYVPIRFVGEALGLGVQWDESQRLVILGDYQEPRDFDEETATTIAGLNLSFVLPEKYKKDIVYEEKDGLYSFYDRSNKEAQGDDYNGWIGTFRLEERVWENPVPHILLLRNDLGYIDFSFASDVNYNIEDKTLTDSYHASVEKVKDILKTVASEDIYLDDRVLADQEEDAEKLACIEEILKDNDREGFLKGVKIYKSSNGNEELYSLVKMKNKDEVSILASFSFHRDDLLHFVLKNYYEDYTSNPLNRQQAQAMAQNFAKKYMSIESNLSYDKEAYPSISDPGKVEAFTSKEEGMSVAVDLESGRVIRAER